MKIFKRLFSSSHKSADPQKRIVAIDSLDPSTPQDKQALHELAFNDEDPHVSLAALRKLSSFALWQKMAQIARDPFVKRESQRFVEEAILGQSHFKLAEKECTAYLMESANNELRIQYLNQHPQTQSDEITLSLLEKINSSSFTLKFINQYATPSLQKIWLTSAHDKKVLQKLKAKTTDKDFADAIKRRLEQLKHDQEKPVKVIQQTTFVLSKLQALAERTDYENITNQRRVLVEEYQQLSQDFNVLSNVQKDEIEEKYSRINGRVEKVLTNLAPEWERQQQALEQAHRLSSLHHLNDDLATLLDELLVVEESSLQKTIKEAEDKRDHLYQEVQQAESFSDDFPQQKFIAVADKVTDTVANITALRGNYAQAKEIIHQSTALIENKDIAFNEKLERQQQLRQSWAKLAESFPGMPADLSHLWRSISKRWKKKVDEADSRQAELGKTCRQQINAIASLIDKGKFNAAIVKFTKLEANLKKLSEKQRTSLAYRFETVRESVQRLEEWKNYLAKPRRPELIEQAKALIAEPIGSIKERAEKVKYLRKQWQSLGSPEKDDEQAMQFDELIERAFAPCRLHYEEQEKLREQTRHNRQQLIEEARDIDINTDIESLAAQYEKLVTRWRQEGRLDSETWHKMKRNWEEVLRPISSKVSHWYQDNRRRKQQLIEQIKAQRDNENLDEAAESAKQAQLQWKAIGYAGKKDENKLWRAFRAVNDEVFTRVKARENQIKDDYAQKKASLLGQIQSFNHTLIEKDTSDSQQTLGELESAIEATGLHNDKAIKNAWAGLVKTARHVEKRKQNIGKQQQLNALLTAIPVYQGINSPNFSIPKEVWEKLDKKQQNWFTDQRQTVGKSRAYLTTTLEWITGIDSPEDAQDERKQINLEQLAAKMEQNHVADFETVLGQWIMCGPLADEEDILFERLSRCVHKTIADLETVTP
ncbi:DUF349 domain-containing protein [Alteromonas ponticola]|uniref:DUF349 domain-containing protein n=1 Tax=Alteromonas aquimaris TaxID=2998417 RepID=A0ABT3P7C6_9ALTE|nr:DUF349 domain-containing protein [Alteromonas aquimaris]MCW8108634.1 DUF349 domain-containing protein [Alteromonas aquimaris]